MFSDRPRPLDDWEPIEDTLHEHGVDAVVDLALLFRLGHDRQAARQENVSGSSRVLADCRAAGVRHAAPGRSQRHDGRGRDGEIDAGDRHQPLDRRIVQRTLRDLAVEQVEILSQAVELTDMPLDRRAFVVGDRLARQPGPARAH